jgi:hypothetical protein
MKLKLNKDGSAVVRNGAPVYVLDSGIEREIDGAAAMKLAIGKHFEASPVMDKLSIPAGMAAAFFGDSFQIQGGKLVALDRSGVQMYSSTRPGELANFDEAFDQLVASYPSKAKILRAPTAPGATSGQPGAGGKTMNRAQFEKLMPKDRLDVVRGGTTITD